MRLRLPEYEYWPYWVFYAPFVPYWIWKSLQIGSFSYFCRVNPGIEFGGFLDYSKSKIIEQIPEKFKPKTQFITSKNEIDSMPEFPFVVKPDVSERGKNVEVICSAADWENYPIEKNLILQEFVDYPLEFGIFYVKMPHIDEGRILSITGKEFLKYKATGKSTLKEFVLSNPRTTGRIEYLHQKFIDEWEIIHSKGTEILLEPIGNHNRGTRFYNASELITRQLTKNIHEIAEGIDGFYYGRFDIKAKSVEALKSGQFLVLEINGANSEPTHIYDSGFSLLQAYQEAMRHLDLQFEISRYNKKTYSSYHFYKAVLHRIF